jgi:hypothetical protein
MSNEVVAQEQENSDSCIDAFVALVVICLIVTTTVFWVSNQ